MVWYTGETTKGRRVTDAGTRVFVDVDGVINAYSGKPRIPSWGWPRETGEYVKVLGFGIVYSPDMISRLRTLTNRDDVAAHWLTTWEARDAWVDLADAVALGSGWEVFYRGGYSDKPWWKLDAMQRLNDGYKGKVVWIDDDIKLMPEAREWLESCDLDILAVSPRTETGITMSQMRKIEEFINE
jgi:hypothetical protein